MFLQFAQHKISYAFLLSHIQLFRQRVGVPKYSAAESYVMMKEPHLWEHMKKYRLEHIEDGILRLK